MKRIALYICIVISLLVNSGGAKAQLNKDYFYYIGKTYLIEGRYQEAIEILNVLLKVDKKAHEAYYLRGIAKYNLDDLIGAEVDFSTAIAHNPVYTRAYQVRAIVRSRLGNYDDALKDFKEAIDLRPDIPNTYFSRGVTLLLTQQFEKAINDFDLFVKSEGRVSDAYLNRGVAYLHLGDTVTAMRDFNLAISVNRDDPNGYCRRGSVYLTKDSLDLALKDFNTAIKCDSTDINPYFNRAIVYSNQRKPMLSLADFDKVIELDSTSSITYFNRAILRSQIGDYNRALEDYNMVAEYSPDNVLVYYNRAILNSQLGNLIGAEADFSRAIELYPDFANAYLSRSNIRFMLKDIKGSKADKKIADQKIADYRSKVADSTFSIYADTSRRFDKLLSFETNIAGSRFQRIDAMESKISLIPLFRFSVCMADTTVKVVDPEGYWLERVETFKDDFNDLNIELTTKATDITPDSVVQLDIAFKNGALDGLWSDLFKRGMTQSLIRQYTSAVNLLSTAIELEPSNPFLYLNRSTTQAEMVDFVSSIDNSYQKITIDSDPSNRLMSSGQNRTYNYNEAIADLNKAIKLYPEFAHLYYNRANLKALSGEYPQAYDDYTKAIELWGNFPEAYYNRGLVQIFMKDTQKGCLDISKAGELGVKSAYSVLRRYAYNNPK